MGRFQKLVFLLDVKNNLGFEFVRSNYGPFSAKLCDILQSAQEDGWVKEGVMEKDEMTKYTYNITAKGKDSLSVISKTIGINEKDRISKWLKNIEEQGFAQMALPELIKYVYEKYPKFAGDFFKKR